MNIPIITQGVYFMANNRVLELTTAFLNSFRTHNKDLMLCLIPYNDDFEQVAALKDTYNFSVFANQELLEICDAISLRFHDNIVGAYRKMVIWEGDFEQFIYIDIDTIVLESLSFVWKNLSHCKIFTSHSNLPEIQKWVWKDSIHKRDKLRRSQIEYAANTGFIVSTRKILPISWIIDQVDEALLLKEDMELFCMEQPFLNYLIVTSGYNYGSLLQFFRWDIGRDISRGIKLEFWAGLPGGKVKKGKLIDPYRRPLFLVHWAGVWRENDEDLTKIPYQKLWSYYRNLDPLNLPEPEVKTENSVLNRILGSFKNK
jgi:hypothetical protein